MAGLVGILHLGVGQSRQAVGAPVDDAAALIDQALVIQLAEGLPDGLGASLVHGEAGPVPVAGGAHLLLLLHDAVAVLLLPGPHALQELLPAQVIAGQALLAQVLLHLDLGGDTGVVRHHDGKGLLVGIRLRLEAAAVHPHLVDPGLHLPGIVHLG